MPRVLLATLAALLILAGAEITVIVVVAHLIGAGLTVAVLIASTVTGLWLARVQGRRAWQALRESAESGVLPDRELGDAALIFAGGALIAIPGFLTDIAGLCAVAPPTRTAVRRIVSACLRRRAAVAGGAPGPGHARTRPHQPGKVIQGHVIDAGAARTRPGEDDTAR